MFGPNISISSSLLPRYMDKNNFQAESLLTYAFTGLNTQQHPKPKRGKRVAIILLCHTPLQI